MPTKRRHVSRIADSEVDEGQRAFLLAEDDLPSGIPVMSFNHFCWSWNAIERGDPDQVPPDGSPTPRELWHMFGRDALELWHEQHGDVPHPLVEHLGLPTG